MKGTRLFGMVAAIVLAAMFGCLKPKPILPKKPLTSGTFQMQFTRKIRGPVELVIDGVRIPVEQKKKKAKTLTISGLFEGKHQYFIASHVEVIGPDHGEVIIAPDQGVFQVHFSNRLKATLYESRDAAAAPKPEGIPGVKAVLD